MKKIYISALASLLFTAGIAQESEPNIKDDTTKIKVGNMTIIFGDDSEEDFEFEDEDPEDNKDNDDYSGIDIEGEINLGMNGWLNTQNSPTFSSEYENMSLNLNQSKAFGMMFLISGLDIANRHLFISPGFGFTWNGYHFKNKKVSITTGSDTTVFQENAFAEDFDKYKLRASYFEIPLTIGARIGNPDDTHFTIEAGAIGGINLGTIVKSRYFADEVKHKSKIKDDFNVNPFKLDAVAKMRIGGFGIYGRYSLTTMFEKGKTQEVYPFTLGVTFGGI